MGQGIKEFKKATKEVTDEIQNAPNDTASNIPPAPAPSRATQTVSQSSDSPKV
jgi:Sec-independent protein translocase protein TatA